MRRYLLGVVITVALVLPAAPAAGGGWWSSTHLDGGSLIAGESISTRVQAYFTTQAEADAAQNTPYYAYLVRGFNRPMLLRAMSKAEPKRWWALEEDATLIKVGDVTLPPLRTNIGFARLSITVPSTVDSGRYHVMLCTEGCLRPFGSSIPTPVDVFETAAAEQQEKRIKRLDRRVRLLDGQVSSLRNGGAAALRQQQASLEALQGRLNDATERADGAEAQVAQLQESSDRLAGRVVELEERQQSAAATTRWVATAVALLALAAVAVWLLGRRRRSDGPPNDPAVRDDTGWERPERLVGSGRR